MTNGSGAKFDWVKEWGPQREREMHFQQQAVEIFGQMMTPLGFSVSSADPFMVSFRSQDMEVVIYHDIYSYHIDISIKNMERNISYSLGLAGELLGIRSPLSYVARNAEEVREGLRQLATTIGEHRVDLLNPDEDLLTRLDETLNREWAKSVRQMEIGGEKIRADKAWHKHDYDVVYSVLHKMMPHELSEEEKKRLEYSRRQLFGR